MNKRTFDDLNEAQQNALLEASAKAQAYYLDEAKKEDAASVKVFEEAGVEIAHMSAEDFRAWQDVAKASSYASFVADVPEGQELLDLALSVE